MKRMVENDPVAPWINSWFAAFYFLARNYDHAIEQAQQVISLEPGYHEARIWLFYSYLKKGMYEEAAKLSSKAGFPPTMDAWVLALAGKKSEARQLLDQIPAEVKVIAHYAYIYALVYGNLGENDRAFEFLNLAYEGRTALMSVLKIDPRIDALRDDPRFDEMLLRMNFPD